jgi:hypothetical protein
LRKAASLRVSALNIVIESPDMHLPGAYRQLFRALAKMQTPVKVRGEQFLEMDSYLTKSKNGDLLFGTLHRFTAIEAMSWYNTEKHQRATASERRQIRVPPNIAANYREIPFAVHLESHTMVFATKTSRSLVSTTQVQSFIVRLAAYPAIYSEFGNIDASLEQDEQELERILKSESIKMLRITVKRPNESFRRFDPRLLERMNRLRAKSLSEESRGGQGRHQAGPGSDRQGLCGHVQRQRRREGHSQWRGRESLHLGQTPSGTCYVRPSEGRISKGLPSRGPTDYRPHRGQEKKWVTTRRPRLQKPSSTRSSNLERLAAISGTTIGAMVDFALSCSRRIRSAR